MEAAALSINRYTLSKPRFRIWFMNTWLDLQTHVKKMIPISSLSSFLISYKVLPLKSSIPSGGLSFTWHLTNAFSMIERLSIDNKWYEKVGWWGTLFYSPKWPRWCLRFFDWLWSAGSWCCCWSKSWSPFFWSFCRQ